MEHKPAHSSSGTVFSDTHKAALSVIRHPQKQTTIATPQLLLTAIL